MTVGKTVVWISGASFGIGAGLARKVPWPDARIINLDIKPSPLYETVTFDLTQPDTWDAVRLHFESEFAGFRKQGVTRAIFMVVGHVDLGAGLAAKIAAQDYRTALIANAVETRFFARALEDRRLVLLSGLDESLVEDLEFGFAD